MLNISHPFLGKWQYNVDLNIDKFFLRWLRKLLLFALEKKGAAQQEAGPGCSLERVKGADFEI